MEFKEQFLKGEARCPWCGQDVREILINEMDDSLPMIKEKAGWSTWLTCLCKKCEKEFDIKGPITYVGDVD